jgi:alanyl-tRNA synthetase
VLFRSILRLVSADNADRLKPGPAGLILDYRRRRELTALHTGQHLLSGTILRITGAATVSMHLGEDTCTIDVDSGEMSGETILVVEEAVADAIEENHSVIIHLCPPEDLSSFQLRKTPPQGDEVIRVVEIEGCDITACCGTHLKSTAEIGMLRVLGAEKYKGMTRISFLSGRRLLRDSRLLRQNAGIVSRALSVPVNETGKGVLEYLKKTAQTEKRLKAMEETAARFRSEALLRKTPNAVERGDDSAIITEIYADLGFNEIRSSGKKTQEQTQAAIILASEPDLKFAAFCSRKEIDLRSLIKEEMEAQSGKGGGGPLFFQGSFGTKDALGAFMQKIEEGTR